ncbi:TPA: hypothetical protein L7M69_005280 [Klebsiella pneumoniae]|nr:hypothetical protein [Klebsiella pneumoniae]
MSINNLSLTSFKIEMCRENADSDELTILSTATAFFYCFNEEIYLITNWHNVTGRNSLTGKPLDTINLSVPNLMALYLPKRIEAVGNSFYLSWRNVLNLIYTRRTMVNMLLYGLNIQTMRTRSI